MESDKKFLYEFKVGMTCDGCSNAIKRILDKQEGNLQFK